MKKVIVLVALALAVVAGSSALMIVDQERAIATCASTDC
jgi:hypothetical protein